LDLEASGLPLRLFVFITSSFYKGTGIIFA